MSVKNAITNAAGNKPAAKTTIQSYVNSMKTEIAKALPAVMTAERFTRITLSALSANPKLASCSPQSFLGAMMQAAQLGLEPNTNLGQAYLIPYGNNCQFQLGYRGLLELAYRSGDVEVVQAHEVKENDEFEYELGLEPKLKHIPAKENRGETVMYYAIVKLKDGGYNFEVASVADMVEHRKKYSKAGSSPWDSNFDEMAKKTILKRVLKYAPLKSDFVRGMAADETVKSDICDDMSLVPNDDVIDAEFETVTVTEDGEIIKTEEN